MNKTLMLPTELDSPGKQQIGVGIIYSVFAFFSMPFLVLLISGGGSSLDIKILSYLELAYHALNFCVFFGILRELLQDSWFMFRLNWKKMFSTIKFAVIAMVGVAYLWYLLYRVTGIELLSIAVYGTLPISEIDILLYSSDLAYCSPVIGLISMVLLSPFVIACAYYAIGFTPAFNVRPWLGYLVVAAVTAIPPICNASTYWDPTVEAVLYFSRLPLHLIACRAYHKTENIWTPIFCLMITNLIACLRMIVLLLTGQ